MYEEALDAFRDVRDIGLRMSEVEQQMAEATDDSLDRLFDEYSELSTTFEARHGYEMEHRTAQVLGGLGFLAFHLLGEQRKRKKASNQYIVRRRNKKGRR